MRRRGALSTETLLALLHQSCIMPTMSETSMLIVSIVQKDATAITLLSAVRRTAGSFLFVIPAQLLHELTDGELTALFRDGKALNPDRSLTVATKDKRILMLAAAQGWATLTTLKQLKVLLKEHPSLPEAIRVFSPVTWRQDIRSRLQSAGLLSLPKLRIWILFFLSIGAFLYIFFRLLPSAEIRIWPNQETENFTTNVYLLSSGATIPVPIDRVRVLPLQRLTVKVDRTITYDQISKNFTGQNAHMTITVLNDADEQFSLRKGTRLVNQAGMRFRLQHDLILPARTKMDVTAVADPIDQFGEVVGERGNVPAGIKWDFPGLTEKERSLVYARNEKPATGGSTAYVNIVTKEDIHGASGHPGAKQRLEQELLMVAKQQVEEERTSRNNLNGTKLVQLKYDELTKVVYNNFSLSESFIGQNAISIPIQGSIEYTVILYDENMLLKLLQKEVLERVSEDRVAVESSLTKDNMNIHVIAPWDDDLKWVKITADLTYNQRYVLNPITPSGAKFGKFIRDGVAGKTATEAYRVIKNLPEVSKAEIKLWPPWAYTLPEIGSNIAITEMEQ